MIFRTILQIIQNANHYPYKHLRFMLFVGEKPSIAQSLAQILGDGNFNKAQSRGVPVFNFNYKGQKCASTSTTGHLLQIDFTGAYNDWKIPEQKLLDNGNVVYQKCKGSDGILSQIRYLSKEFSTIILALDNDREGENICFEIINELKLDQNKVKRLRFSSLTKQELQKAMLKLDKPNQDLSDAVVARQEIDLKVGVAFTRFITNHLKVKFSGLGTDLISYGPCQTPTLQLCVTRQQEINNFKPQRIYSCKVQLRSKNDDIIECSYPENLKTEKEALDLQGTLQGIENATVDDVIKKSERVSRPAGLNTVQLLRLASEQLGLSPHSALQQCEHLYLNGYVTYPRTESSAYPKDFDFDSILNGLYELDEYADIIDEIDKEQIKRPTGGVNAGDHPPITPTASPMFQPTPLYKLIVKCFLQSISADAEFTIIKAKILLNGKTLDYTQKFVEKRGWMRFKHEPMPDSSNMLQLSKNQTLNVTNVRVQSTLTSPPSLLTESSLLALMEKNQIGTDASMATHIQNICDRKYVELGPGRTLKPTKLGMQLIQALETVDAELVDTKLRSNMEQMLDRVANGKVSKKNLIIQQLQKYQEKLCHLKKSIDVIDKQFQSNFKTLEQSGKPFLTCPVCKTYTKLSQNRSFVIYCHECGKFYDSISGEKLVATNCKCKICGMDLASTKVNSDGLYKLQCLHCYTNSDDKMFGDTKPTKDQSTHIPCSQCMNQQCQYSLHNNFIGMCHFCNMSESDGSKNDRQNTKQQKSKKQADVEDIVITGDEINIIVDEPDKKPQNQSRTTQGLQQLFPGRLYLDIGSQQICQIQCTSCNTFVILPQGKPQRASEKCEKCGKHKITLKTKTDQITQCAFCEMTGVVIKEARKGNQYNFGPRNNNQQHGGHRGNQHGSGQRSGYGSRQSARGRQRR